MPKQIQPVEQIVQSLLNLRNEMVARGQSEIAFKINSCLFSQYPHEPHSAAWREKYAASSWINDVDRQSGAFTQEEIANSTAWR